MHSFEMEFDGGSRGNPGPAAAGVVVREADTDDPWLEFGEHIGSRTNNQAEYTALKRGLIRFMETLDDRGIPPGRVKLSMTTDSQLLEKQLEGDWKTKDGDLRELQNDIRNRLERLGGWSIRHVPREQNREADELVNQALDRHLGNGDSGEDTAGKPSGTGSDSQPEPATTLFLTVHGTGGSKSTSGSWSYRLEDDQDRELILRKEMQEVDDANLAVFHAVRNGLDTIRTLLEGAGNAPEDERSGEGSLEAPERTCLIIQGVNDVVLKQISGEYACKNPDHRQANEQIRQKLSAFHSVETRRADEADMEALKKADTLA